jgi:hypothetical protein
MQRILNRVPQRWWLPPILLLGLGLRLTGLWWGQGYFYFGQGDGVQAYSVAVDYAKGEPRAQYLGQPNYNAHSKLPGPLWTLFCLLGLKIGKSIDGVMVALILLNVAAIYLTYLLANWTLGPPASFWAALLAATLPAPVFYSVGVYNPEVMPFLGACLCLALWRAITQERSRHIVWVGILICMMPQFHMSGLTFLPATAAVLWLSPVRINRAWLLAGLQAGVLLYLPYLFGEAANGWTNTRGMLSGDGHGFSWEGFKALSFPLSLLVNWVPQWTRNAGIMEYREVGRVCFGWFGLCLVVNLVSGMAGLTLLVGAAREIASGAKGFWRAPRAAFARSPGILFPAIMLIIPLLSVLIIGQPFHARYALGLLAPLLVLAGAGAARWLKAGCSMPHLGRYLSFALVFTTFANIWFMPAFYRYQEYEISHGPVFIPSFRHLESVYQTLRAHAGPNRGVHVYYGDYVMSAATGGIQPDAWLVGFYVNLREKESALATAPVETVVYWLCKTNEVRIGDPKLAFQKQGLALIERSRQLDSEPSLKLPR